MDLGQTASSPKSRYYKSYRHRGSLYLLDDNSNGGKSLRCQESWGSGGTSRHEGNNTYIRCTDTHLNV